MTSKVRFISDLHIGHKKILEFSGILRGGLTVDEHDEWIVDSWNSVVNKRDVVWVLGDICFDKHKLHLLGQLRGRVRVLLGNHDMQGIPEHFRDCLSVHGLATYKGFWVSHCPIHPMELRGRKGNIHGHLHEHLVGDPHYVNVCVEHNFGRPMEFDEVLAKWEEGFKHAD